MKRSTIIVVAVFAILLIAAVLINDRPVQRGSERLSFADLDTTAVDHLAIEATGEEGVTTIELSREDGMWRLADGHLADADLISRALDGLKAVDTSDVVSASAERQATYEVDVDSGITVQAAAGSRKLARLVIGSAAGGGSYVRAVGEDLIFQTSHPLRHLFPTEIKRWLKLKLFDATLDQAVQVDVRLADGHSYSIVPTAEGDQWTLTDPGQLPEGFRFDGPGARSLATTVLNLRAKEIVEGNVEAAATGLEAEHDAFTVRTGSGSATVHLGADADDSTVYARVDGRDALLKVPVYQARNLRKHTLDLRDLRLMQVDSAQAVAVAISHGASDVRLRRSEAGAWEIDPEGEQPAAGFAYDPQSVDRFLQSFANLKATSLAGDVKPSATGLGDPTPRITVTMADGSTAELIFGRSFQDDEDRTLYYARGNADEQVYLVGEYQRNRFTRGLALFEVVEPPPNMGGGGNPLANIDPQTLANLPPEVRESLMKQMQEEQQKQRMLEQMRRQQGGGQ